jgi:hypothetical protein
VSASAIRGCENCCACSPDSTSLLQKVQKKPQ